MEGDCCDALRSVWEGEGWKEAMENKVRKGGEGGGRRGEGGEGGGGRGGRGREGGGLVDGLGMVCFWRDFDLFFFFFFFSFSLSLFSRSLFFWELPPKWDLFSPF